MKITICDVGGVVADALEVLGDEGDAHGAADVLRLLDHVGQELAEELHVQRVDRVVGREHLARQIDVAVDEGVERLVQHRRDRLAHARDVDVRLERRLLVELQGALGQVHRQVADALEVGDHLERRRHEAQVGAGRLAQGEDVQAQVIDRHLGRVDGAIGLDHPARQVGVALHQGLEGVGDHLLDGGAEVEDLLLQLLELVFIMPAGVFHVARPPGRGLHSIRTAR
jgi:hypothetical protein